MFRSSCWLAPERPARSNGAQTFTANLSGAQETPPNASSATGVGTFTLSADQSTLTFTVTYSGLSSGTGLAAHFHDGSARRGRRDRP